MLVVDYDSGARALLKSILERCGTEIIEVSSASEALQSFELLKPDIVVSDIDMPIEDGYAFIRKVREREIEDRLRALSAVYQAYVAKPVEPAELVATIASPVFPKV